MIEACGLPWEPACLEFHRTERPIRTASVMQVRQPVYQRSVARWKNYEPALAELFAGLPREEHLRFRPIRTADRRSGSDSPRVQTCLRSATRRRTKSLASYRSLAVSWSRARATFARNSHRDARVTVTPLSFLTLAGDSSNGQGAPSTRGALHRLRPGVSVLVPGLTSSLPVRRTIACGGRSAGRLHDQIKPILTRHCVTCHGAAKPRGGLRLDTAAAALAGGKGGPAVLPGKGAESPLVEALRGEGATDRMPLNRPPLPEAEIKLIEAWIDQGAKARPGESPGVPPAKLHWAFVRPVRPAVPRLARPGWASNPIDRFIQARLEAAGLSPSPEADRRTLIRRLSLDLIGLPPSSG